MIISIARTKTLTPEGYPSEVKVTFRVPTSEDMQSYLAEAQNEKSNLWLWKRCVTSLEGVSSDDGHTITKDEVPTTPGLWLLVATVAGEILKSAMLRPEVKNG